MREAIRRPALRARRARFILLSRLCCLGLPGPVFQVLIDLVPLLKSSPPGPTFRQAYHLNALGASLFASFFRLRFLIDFFSILGSIWDPKMRPKPEKIGKQWMFKSGSVF